MELILYTGVDCHLCHRLEEMMAPHVAELRRRRPVVITKRNIAEHGEWKRLYGDRIPVLVCDGEVLVEGRPEAEEVDAVFRAMEPHPRAD